MSNPQLLVDAVVARYNLAEPAAQDLPFAQSINPTNTLPVSEVAYQALVDGGTLANNNWRALVAPLTGDPVVPDSLEDVIINSVTAIDQVALAIDQLIPIVDGAVPDPDLLPKTVQLSNALFNTQAAFSLLVDTNNGVGTWPAYVGDPLTATLDELVTYVATVPT